MKRLYPYTDYYVSGTRGMNPTALGAWLMEQGATSSEDGSFSATWKPEGQMTVEVKDKLLTEGGAHRQYTRITNTTGSKKQLEVIHSLLFNGIGVDGEKLWHEDRLLFHFCCSAWQAEGQWRSATPEELGLYPAYNHYSMGTFILSSNGTWSTSKRYPLLLIEDREAGKTYYFEVESGTSWSIQVFELKSGDRPVLAVATSNTNCDIDNWSVSLEDGESYQTTTTIYGVVDGGPEEAFRALCDAKRALSIARYPTGHIPLCFNDYMNCLWGKPTGTALRPLVDAAAKAGAEVFCIDAGWYSERKDGKLAHGYFGDWTPCDVTFGDDGFQGMIQYIVSHGMIPGVWLEMEVCHIYSEFAKKHPELLLRREGEPIRISARHFLDFSKPLARQYIMDTVDMLYGYGVRYIKNDYNSSVGIGCDGPSSLAENLRQNSLAFYSLIDEILQKHPDMIIENCGSGGLRLDGLTLSHFHLQSTSDQECYYRYPSILQGVIALLPPEKAGIWSYPYPILYEKMEQLKDQPFVPDDAYIQQMASGRETVFNMVNGLFGCMYLSGDISKCDEKNAALIKQGCDAYKKIRDMIPTSYPVYPSGMLRISASGFASMGLLCPTQRTLLLGVWKIETEKTDTALFLSRYVGENATVERLYPSDEDVRYSFDSEKQILSLSFPAEENAAIALLIHY